jgi:hypothetical protein
VRVDFGPVQPLATAVESWHKENSQPAGVQLPEGARRLRRLLWDKLAPHLQGKKLVRLSPDGPAAQFPWPALPGKAPGSWLIDDAALAVVPVVSLLPDMLGTDGRPTRPNTPAAVATQSLLLASPPAWRWPAPTALLGPTATLGSSAVWKSPGLNSAASI